MDLKPAVGVQHGTPAGTGALCRSEIALIEMAVKICTPETSSLLAAGACINVYGCPARSKIFDTWGRPLGCVEKEPTSANGLGHQVEEAGASEFHTHLDGPSPAMPVVRHDELGALHGRLGQPVPREQVRRVQLGVR